MRRTAATIFIVSLLLVLAGGFSEAGLDNSHHDVTGYHSDKNACLVCHSRNDINSYEPMAAALGRVGGQCLFLCHSGKGILPETDTLVPRPGPSVSMEDYATADLPDFTTVYFTRSHGRNPANLKDGQDRPVPWPPRGVTWSGVADNTLLECTSCHDVHDNRFPPFLVAPLGATFPAFDGMCDRCHAERATNNLSDAPDGNHPVDFVVDNAAGRSGFGRRPRTIKVQRYGRADGTGTTSVFDVSNPPPAAFRERNAAWNMGGHLTAGPDRAMEAWRGDGGAQQMGCYTCHAAHRANAVGENNLVVVRTMDNQAAWNPLCVGCHGAATSLEGDREEWNVGTTAFGHPGGSRTSRDATGQYTATTGGFQFRIAAVQFVNPRPENRFGKRGELLCTTCHRVHFGASGTMAAANLGQGTKSVCKACHSGVGHLLPANRMDPPNSHHVTLTPELMVERLKWGFANPPWAETAGGRGDLATGMDCADCHMYATAHGWD